MSFFLSSKPPVKAVRPKLVVANKTKTQAAPAPRVRDWTWGWLLLGMLLCASLGTGWYGARSALRQELAHRNPAPVGAQAIRLDAFKDAPWVSENAVKLLREDMGNCLSADPLDGESLSRAAALLEKHPAIQKVKRIYRDHNGLVHIEALAYHPAAMVNGSAMSVVDGQGHLLTEALDPSVADRLPIPRFDGVQKASPFGNEAIWQDVGLQAGLKLLATLTPNENRHIKTLQVGQRDNHQRPILSFTLAGVATQPIDIEWGLPIGEEAGVDGSVENKLNALRNLYANPEVRSGHAGSRFSIRSGSAKALDDEKIDSVPTSARKTHNP